MSKAICYGKSELVSLVMEYAERGDLGKYLKRYEEQKEYLSEDRVWGILIQVVRALAKLHEMNVIH